ncbi:MAG: glycosyltransferase family 2 protein [Patescibacteria group bacterium]|nr:glycosyltransferase family 2 protein [Patescibacteria group bacterium]
MKLSMIMPVYNEAATLEKILNKVLAVGAVTELVVVDDGSTDDSLKIAKKFKRNLSKKDRKRLKIFSKENEGKGSAVRYGLEKVSGDYVLIQDADLEYDPQDLAPMIKALEKDGVEVVFGSRFLGPHSNLLFWHRVGNLFLNLFINILYDTTLSDMETCYKLVPTDLMRELNLKANKFDLEPEITCKILKKGINIFEVPISYVGRGFEEGKKITWKDGLGAFWTIFKMKLTNN